MRWRFARGQYRRVGQSPEPSAAWMIFPKRHASAVSSVERQRHRVASGSVLPADAAAGLTSLPEAWLAWPGRRFAPRDQEAGLPPPIVMTESADGGGAEPRARLIHGDALDLVYVDPPFASQAMYVHEARLDGPADGRVVRAPAYDDRWGAGVGAYLEMLAPRLEALTRLLSPSGTIWVHVDWRASYLVRLLLDEILGRDAFKNEIVWRRAPNLGRQAASNQFGRTLDTIVVYGGPAAKLAPPLRLEPVTPGALRWDEQGRPFTGAPRGDYTDKSIQRLEEQGRVHRTASGKVYIKYYLVKNSEGAWCRERRVDTLWTDVPPLRHARPGERTGFPTQKPRALLDRIVACASPPGGLVVDLFAGSGTTGESAYALGRRFVLGDASPLALATARARLLRAGLPLVVQACGCDTAARGQGARVAFERSGQGVRVELLEPREPLAWAIDASYDPTGPFRVAWHSERSPDGRTVRAALAEAAIERAPGPVAVRVFFDDGRVETLTVEGP
jgi:DNA modification methylase